MTSITQKNFTSLYSFLFLSVLYQNKALHNFHKKGQHLTARHIKGLDWSVQNLILLNIFAFWRVLSRMENEYISIHTQKMKPSLKVTQRYAFSKRAMFGISLCYIPKPALVIDHFWQFLALLNLIKRAWLSSHIHLFSNSDSEPKNLIRFNFSGSFDKKFSKYYNFWVLSRNRGLVLWVMD